jgi:transcriptional regulator with XRE-family HTH domain
MIELMAVEDRRTIGALLREWRERRRLSQLELALQARVSTRHLSFLETGRSLPSRDMVLHLAEELDVPLRERNLLLLAGGYAPVYRETALDVSEMSAIRAAVRQLLAGHEPHPALVVDRTWNLVEANASFDVFTEGAAPELLVPPCNVLRLALHPEGLAPRTVNLGVWRAHVLRRLGRAVVRSGDAEMARLLEELQRYPCDQPEPDTRTPGPGDVAVPLRIRHGDRQLAFIAIVAAFGTPLDITVAELVIESFFPADQMTSTFLIARAQRRSAAEARDGPKLSGAHRSST